MGIRFTTLALRDIQHIKSYTVEKFGRKQANAVINKLGYIVRQLQSFPESGAEGRVSGTREVLIPDTPFIVVYRIRDEWIEIVACLHQSQRWLQMRE